MCTITLKSHKGACALTAKELKPGSYQLTASYPGQGGFTSSVSAPVKLKVAK